MFPSSVSEFAYLKIVDDSKSNKDRQILRLLGNVPVSPFQ